MVSVEVDDGLLAACLNAAHLLGNGFWLMVKEPWEDNRKPWRVGPSRGPWYRGRTPDSACRNWLKAYKRAARD